MMGPAEVELSMAGMIEIGSSTTSDGQVDQYTQIIDDSRTVTAFVHNMFYVYRDPAGAITGVDFSVRLEFYSGGRPNWGWRLYARHTLAGPQADPFAE